MENEEVQHSILYLPPYDGESISNYLGRWCRQEVVSIDTFALGKRLRLGKTLWRWERFYLNPFPTRWELQKIDKLMEVGIDRLLLMFPPPHEPLVKPDTIRICAACYAETPYHRMSWQYKSTEGCEQHRLRLLSRCPDPKCGEPFPIPSKIKVLACKKCGMPYSTMANKQKSY